MEIGLDPATLHEYTAQNNVAILLSSAGLTLYIYDYFLTLEDEVALVWKARPHFSMAKILFYLNRYYSLLTYTGRAMLEYHDRVIFRLEFLNECRTAVIREFVNWSICFNFIIVEVILMLSVWALWDCNRKTGWLIVLVFIVFNGVGLLLGVLDLYPGNLKTAATPPDSMFACSDQWSPHAMLWMYISTMGVQIFSFILFLIKTGPTTSKDEYFGTVRPSVSKSLWKHGGMYYMIVILLQILLIMSTIHTSLFLIFDTAQPMNPFMSVVCTRLILSLRSVLFNQATSTSIAESVLESQETEEEDARRGWEHRGGARRPVTVTFTTADFDINSQGSSRLNDV